jgi:uncharacterized protein
LKVTLVDTGPIVAFLNRRDRHHAWVVEAFRALAPPLVTCEAVLSEATFLLRGIPGAPARLLDLVDRHVLAPTFRIQKEIRALTALMARYANVHMDLADACLVRLSELHPDSVVLTLDSGFRDVYRRHGRRAIATLLPARRRR